MSSNFRKLNNPIDALADAGLEGLPMDSKVYLVIENSTKNSSFFWGTSTSKELFEPVLWA